MHRRWLRCGGLALCLMAVLSCRMNEQQTKLQYMPDMADAPTAKAQESYLDAPDGAIALEDEIYPATAEEAERTMAYPEEIKRAHHNRAQRGKELWDTFCIPCHGPVGRGKGTLGDVYPYPPDITTATYAKRRDGFFFHRITFGSGAVMPGYGHATTVEERWLIISYMRKLQGVE